MGYNDWLVENQRLIYYFCHKNQGLAYLFGGFEDYVQEMNLELCRALPKYDATLGVNISAYALMIMKNKMLNRLRASTTLRRFSGSTISLDVPCGKSGELELMDILPDTRQEALLDATVLKLLYQRFAAKLRPETIDRYSGLFSLRELPAKYNKSYRTLERATSRDMSRIRYLVREDAI